jgi:hypothetical protein
MLHQEYEIKKDFQTYFKETENDTELFSSPSWDENRIISFNRGEKVYLKDFEGQDARYLETDKYQSCDFSNLRDIVNIAINNSSLLRVNSWSNRIYLWK